VTEGNGSTNGFTTKDFLVRLDNKVDALDAKMEQALAQQVCMQTILTEGHFGERLSMLEHFKDRTEGAFGLIRWAVGGSGIAIVIGVLSLFLTLAKDFR
jgi:hypothetical protein